jgi:hypothetical protein
VGVRGVERHAKTTQYVELNIKEVFGGDILEKKNTPHSRVLSYALLLRVSCRSRALPWLFSGGAAALKGVCRDARTVRSSFSVFGWMQTHVFIAYKHTSATLGKF